MRKYAAAYAVSLQETLQLRWAFVMDRVRGLALILSLYFLWSTLLAGQNSFLGYSRRQMITYVLGMSLLRALVLSSKGWQLIHEISSGKLSNYLVRPVSFFAFHLSRELAQKTVLAASAAAEIAVLVLVFGAPFYVPHDPWTVPLFLLASALSMLVYYQLTLLVCSAAFWTAESVGPLFCFELILQFSAGAFFPLDVLPAAFQRVLYWTPFPYLIFFPLQIYLERAPAIGPALAVQAAWLAALALAYRSVWRVGLRDYAAEGG